MADETVTVPTITDFDGVETIPEVAPPQPQAEGAGAAAPEEQTFDEVTYLKGLGFESREEVASRLAELADLRKFKEEAPKPLSFANDNSQKFFDYVKEGKTPELREFLNQQERLERMSAADASKLEQAGEIIKLNMQLKNPDLTADEIAFQFSEDFEIPERPEQDEDEDDVVFQKREDRWKKEVERVEKRMIIAAKTAKPELAKYHSELVLPDIQKIDPKAQEAAQKELQAAEAEKAQYLTKLNGEFQNFSGYNASYKDKDVELGIAYGISEEEKTAVKSVLESFATDGYADYFGKRWFESDGTPKIGKIMSDVYLLDNQEKVFQKLVNEAAAQRLDQYLKAKSNIRIDENVPRGTFQPNDVKAQEEKALEYLMGA